MQFNDNDGNIWHLEWIELELPGFLGFWLAIPLNHDLRIVNYKKCRVHPVMKTGGEGLTEEFKDKNNLRLPEATLAQFKRHININAIQ